MGEEEINWAVEFVCPLFARCNGSLLGIDFKNGSGTNHGIERSVAPSDDSASVLAGQRSAFSRQQRGFFRRRVKIETVWQEIASLFVQRTIIQQKGGVGARELVVLRWSGLGW